jgi:transcriptional regulator with XRE-family HTH domain
MKKDVAPALTDAELEKLLLSIGQTLKEAREGKKTLDDLAYEINLSRSALARLEAGGDPRLSTLLKVMYGLRVKPVEVFKDLK